MQLDLLPLQPDPPVCVMKQQHSVFFMSLLQNVPSLAISYPCYTVTGIIPPEYAPRTPLCMICIRECQHSVVSLAYSNHFYAVLYQYLSQYSRGNLLDQKIYSVHQYITFSPFMSQFTSIYTQQSC